MYINCIKINNYKAFSEERVIKFSVPDTKTLGSGLNIFVGENNSGKSSVFEAFSFLRNGTPKGKTVDEFKNRKLPNPDLSVEIIFEGNIEQTIDTFVQDNKKDTLKKFIYSEDGKNYLKIKRTSSSEDSICVWNKEKDTFENPSGIDAPIKKLFELDFIWADTNPDDIVNFSSTKICGKLFKTIAEEFFKNEQWSKFKDEHRKTFHEGDESFKAKTDEIATSTQKIISEQFGDVTVGFDFALPETESFFKTTKITINDGEETALSEKGMGTQRATALALLQVYANAITKHPDSDIQKPFYLFIDEPEICLHPQAQKKLLSAFKHITKSKQIFITTHSPYFIEPDLISNVYRFEKNSNVDIYHCLDKTLVSDMIDKENKIFFSHHKEIFFGKHSFFVEGADDYKLYTMFCEKNNIDNIFSNLYFLSGVGDWSKISKLCTSFNIKSFFLMDLDVLNKSSTTFKDLEDVVSNITTLDKVLVPNPDNPVKAHPDKKERCNNLLDSNLKKEELDIKNKIIDSLKGKNIFVLRHGMLENYLDEKGNVIESNVLEKTNELVEIFNSK